ncbi:MAG: TrmH family RNA methyltransferase [Candidatus Taylorbacteria bacterium]|nr:TrmH family RNA methyltransferase [Candidatus Taylorbacteria bacterium]
MKLSTRKTYAVLYNIRSVHNVGSIFRTADCFGVSEVILVGYTPAPIDRFGRILKAFGKVSLGAEVSVSWRQFGKISEALSYLREQRVFVVAVEQDEKSKDYRRLKLKQSVAYIFGNEVGGIPKKIVSECDVVVEIPMHGKKESLNVSVTAGIILAHYKI